jgi:hypothetical protein
MADGPGEIRATWEGLTAPIRAGAGGDDSDLEVYEELWPDPEQVAAEQDRRVAERAEKITKRFAGYRPGPPLFASADGPLSLDEVYHLLGYEDG